MYWVIASLVSALLLGIYDLYTKAAVRDNAVLPVLFFANVCSAGIWLSLIAVHAALPQALPVILRVVPLSPLQHAELLLKSAIIAGSWVCVYFAVRHLPVSLVSPIRATGPVWTLIGALAVLAERPSLLQILGVLTTLGSFMLLSLAGKSEGIHFFRNKWIGWLFVGILLNSISSLYDKYLLNQAHLPVASVQAWFSIYLAILFLLPALGWKFRLWPRHDFHWTWAIIGVSVALLFSDFIYFTAVGTPHALISVVVSLRRGNMLVAFAGGILFFKEGNGRQKLPAVIGVILGIVLTLLG